MKRIHIVGCSPRSGTTLMKNLIINCFDIDLYDEGESSIFSLPKYRGNIYVTKFPGDIQRIDYILNKMKQLYILCMLRDPRDIISSVHWHHREKYWCGLRYWKKWTPYIDRLIHHPRFILVRYEKLVSEPNTVQREIKEILPFLEQKRKFTEFHKYTVSYNDNQALSGIRPLSTTSISNWKKHIPRIKGQIDLHGPISDDLIKYGYEKNNNWEKLLDDVTPDYNSGYLPEYTDQKRLRKFLRFNRLKVLLILVASSLPCLLRWKSTSSP